MAKVAVLQMISSANVEENLAVLKPLFSHAEEEGAELVVLPENFAFMGMTEPDKLKIAEPYGRGKIQQAIQQRAKDYGVWVIAGTIYLQCDDQRVHTSCLVYDAAGECVARYDKMHLFDVAVSEQESYQESKTIKPGDTVVVVETPVGCVGLSVCYDLRFPELYRALVLKGAEILVVPSAFTAVTGLAHWEVLVRARAIENLCYVLAPNQGGLHANGRQTYGHSMIVGPWGEVLSAHESGLGMVFADLDLKHLHQLRQQFPCNDHHLLSR